MRSVPAYGWDLTGQGPIVKAERAIVSYMKQYVSDSLESWDAQAFVSRGQGIPRRLRSKRGTAVDAYRSRGEVGSRSELLDARRCADQSRDAGVPEPSFNT
jgi:hypothetical protein